MGAAGHARGIAPARNQHINNGDVAVQIHNAARGNRRNRGAPGAAAGAQPQRSPGAAVQRLAHLVPAVEFQAAVAVPAQPVPPQVATPKGKRKHKASAAAPPPEEDNVPTCAICLDSLKSELCCAPCGHVFHFKCLKEAINKFKYCPTCRKAIKKETLIKKIFM